MDFQQTLITSIVFYKFASIASGTFIAWMGYKLFLADKNQQAGSVEVTTQQGWKLNLKKMAPGTFFSILGAAIIGATLYKGLDVYKESGRGNVPESKISNRSNLPSKLPD